MVPEIPFRRVTGSMQQPKRRAVEAAWLPGGYRSDLGERARSLSGGQTTSVAVMKNEAQIFALVGGDGLNSGQGWHFWQGPLAKYWLNSESLCVLIRTVSD